MARIISSDLSPGNDIRLEKNREDLLKEATLKLDFENNTYVYYDGPVNGMVQTTLNGVLDFSRGSEATVEDALGRIATVGVDQQRLVGLRGGLLIEEARTNLLLWSEDLTDAEWGKANVSVTTFSTDKFPSAFTLTAETGDGSSTLHRIFQSVGFDDSGSTRNGVMCAAKAGTANGIGVTFRSNSGQAGGQINLNTGEIINAGGQNISSSEISVEDVGDGWFLIKHTALTTVSAASFYVIDFNKTGTGGNNNFVSDGTESVHIAAPQAEADVSFLGSYIKTEATQVTRAADNCSRTLGAEFSGGQGTIVATIPGDIVPSNGPYVWTMQPTRFGLRIIQNGNAVIYNRIGGSNLDLSSNTKVDKKSIIAVTYNKNTGEQSITINGNNPIFGAYQDGELPSEIFIGGFQENSSDSINSRILEFDYIPKALSPEELRAVTQLEETE